MNRTKLTIGSLVYSQMQLDTYVLVLNEEEGNMKLPIVIGTYEAQAIAIALEAMTPGRPFTHDLFVNFALAHNIRIIEVEIVKFEEGVFSSELTCESDKGIIRIDARTSDAISLAIRFKCPIYVKEEVMERAGIISSSFEIIDEDTDNEEIAEEEDKEPDLSKYDKEELEKFLQKAIKIENYELASKLRDELKNRD